MNERSQENNSSPLPGSSEGQERLRWRSWPCAKCDGVITPVGYIFRRSGAGSKVQPAIPEEIAALHIKWLQEWVAGCSHQPIGEFHLPKLAEGSEHLVYLDADRARVFKVTRQGIFGESYYLENGRMAQKNCSPLEYLIRLRLWKQLFMSAPKDLGLTEAGQIVSVQQFIVGTRPTQESVDAFLSLTLTPVRQKYWLWKKAYTDFELWVGDAREDNFVQAEGGIVPIDIRLWFMDKSD